MSAAAVWFALFASAPLRAQDAREHTERLERLVELRRQIEAVTDSANQAMARAGALDSARVGRLNLYFSGQHRSAVQEGADSAAILLEAALGSEVALLDRLLIAVGFTNDAVAAPEQPGKATLTMYVSPATAEGVQRALLIEASRWLSDQLDSVFREWIRLAIPVADTVIDWAELWVEFATAASPLVPICERGDEPECLVALGIVPVENPILDWYDAEGRRQLVRQLPNYFGRDQQAIDVCLDRRWDQICIDILERQEAIAPPLSHRVRRALLQYALAQAPGGFARLLVTADSNDQIDAVLSAVAREDFTTLLRDWRARIASSRPDGVSVRFPTAATTVIWIGLFVSLRLAVSRRGRTRSSEPTGAD